MTTCSRIRPDISVQKNQADLVVYTSNSSNRLTQLGNKPTPDIANKISSGDAVCLSASPSHFNEMVGLSHAAQFRSLKFTNAMGLSFEPVAIDTRLLDTRDIEQPLWPTIMQDKSIEIATSLTQEDERARVLCYLAKNAKFLTTNNQQVLFDARSHLMREANRTKFLGNLCGSSDNFTTVLKKKLTLEVLPLADENVRAKGLYHGANSLWAFSPESQKKLILAALNIANVAHRAKVLRAFSEFVQVLSPEHQQLLIDGALDLKNIPVHHYSEILSRLGRKACYLRISQQNKLVDAICKIPDSEAGYADRAAALGSLVADVALLSSQRQQQLKAAMRVVKESIKVETRIEVLQSLGQNIHALSPRNQALYFSVCRRLALVDRQSACSKLLTALPKITDYEWNNIASVLSAPLESSAPSLKTILGRLMPLVKQLSSLKRIRKSSSTNPVSLLILGQSSV